MTDPTSPNTFVIILKKVQGGIWQEAGRTELCPTSEWLAREYGGGNFELRLESEQRVLCIATVHASEGQIDVELAASSLRA